MKTTKSSFNFDWNTTIIILYWSFVNLFELLKYFSPLLTQAIVRETLIKYSKRLDKEQMVSLLSKESSQNPLWLSIACEELRLYGTFEKLNDKINKLADGLLK